MEAEEVWTRHSCPLCGAICWLIGDDAAIAACWSCKKLFSLSPEPAPQDADGPAALPECKTSYREPGEA
jgi:hypothetical protein